MKTITAGVLWIAVAAVPALAQQPTKAAPAGDKAAAEPKKSPETHEVDPTYLMTRVFTLKYANCVDLVRVVQRLGRGRVDADYDQRTNSLIVMTTEDLMPKQEQLIAALDVPIQGASLASPPLRIVRLKHRSANDMVARLEELMGKSGRSTESRFAADPTSGCLILRGTEDFAATVGEIVAQLDTPARNVQLEFAFFQADQYPHDSKKTIPDDLAEVAKSLERFGTLELLGRLSCTATEGEPAHIQGGLGTGLNAKISTRIAKIGGEGSVNMSLAAELRVTEIPTPPEDKTRPVMAAYLKSGGFNVETNITTRRGDMVVIGTAPAGMAEGQSVILVMQVRP